MAVVDDDDSIRFLVQTLLEREGIEATTYVSAEAFLADYRPGAAGCLVLDLCLPGISGLELQEELIRRGFDVPILFFTAQGSVPIAVRALKRGAVDFVEKPFDNKDLMRRIRESIPAGAAAAPVDGPEATATGRLAQLTLREREVMDRVVLGNHNKCIADELGICVKTVEYHRARIMQKTGVRSLAELVGLAVAQRDWRLRAEQRAG
ncbi:MAG: response regulator [Betaproteobacteria bacterium]